MAYKIHRPDKKGIVKEKIVYSFKTQKYYNIDDKGNIAEMKPMPKGFKIEHGYVFDILVKVPPKHF